MSQYSSERLLAIFYPVIIGCAFVCSVTSAVAWNHWKYVLDTCVYDYFSNCGCILNGKSTPTTFQGGHVSNCHWAVYGLVVPIFVAIIFGSYHVGRVCMGRGKSSSGQKTIHQRSGDIMIMTTHSEISEEDDSISPYYWMPAAILSCIMFIYTLVHASMFTDGFLQSCNQYRYELVKHLHASGNMVEAIQGRLACSTVFDFMDYLHPDVSYDRRREGRINTAACLVLALITTWTMVVLWICTLVINIKQWSSSRAIRQ